MSFKVKFSFFLFHLIYSAFVLFRSIQPFDLCDTVALLYQGKLQYRTLIYSKHPRGYVK